jgi:hypothetical protein
MQKAQRTVQVSFVTRLDVRNAALIPGHTDLAVQVAEYKSALALRQFAQEDPIPHTNK